MSQAAPPTEPSEADDKSPGDSLAPLARSRRLRTKRLLVIDLGGWTTKAIHMERSAEGLQLINYLLQPSPFLETNLDRAGLAEHLRQIRLACGGKTKRAVIVLSMNQGLIRQVNVPDAAPSELRNILRLNSKQFVQQSLVNCALDVCLTGLPEVPERVLHQSAQEAPVPQPVPGRKTPTGKAAIVGVIPEEMLKLIEEASKDADLILEEVTLSQIGIANAALWGLVGIQKGVTALVDIGFRCSTITILWDGQIALNRVVPTGGDAISAQLADEMNATYRVAEAIKVSLPERAQDKLLSAVKGLCDELRVAIDFFEHTYEMPVVNAWISGAAASSPCMIETLQTLLRLPCKPVSLNETLSVNLPKNQVTNLEAHGPQLAPALGAAASRLESSGLRLNFLAEKEEAEYRRRRDPVRWARKISLGCFALILIWIVYLGAELGVHHVSFKAIQNRFNAHAATIGPFEVARKEIGLTEKVISDLHYRSTNRFLVTGPLNALQDAMVENITVARLTLSEQITFTPSTRKTNLLGAVVGNPPASHRHLVLTIVAKDYGMPPMAEKFITAIQTQAWFKANLRAVDPVLVRERQPEQVDPLQPGKTFRLTRVECYFKPTSAYDE